jgi:hypothetical protein
LIYTGAYKNTNGKLLNNVYPLGKQMEIPPKDNDPSKDGDHPKFDPTKKKSGGNENPKIDPEVLKSIRESMKSDPGKVKRPRANPPSEEQKELLRLSALLAMDPAEGQAQISEKLYQETLMQLGTQSADRVVSRYNPASLLRKR